MPEIAGTSMVSAEIEALDRRLGLPVPKALRLNRRSKSCGRAELLAQQVAQRRASLGALPPPGSGKMSPLSLVHPGA